MDIKTDNGEKPAQRVLNDIGELLLATQAQARRLLAEKMLVENREDLEDYDIAGLHIAFIDPADRPSDSGLDLLDGAVYGSTAAEMMKRLGIYGVSQVMLYQGDPDDIARAYVNMERRGSFKWPESGDDTAIVVVALGGWSTFVVERDSGKLIHRNDGEHWPDDIWKLCTQPAEEEPDCPARLMS
ncbi:hypothetical protein WMF04_24460 [Sorangium sp. So ce260]|uniref:hypothetical protein n=1 Tax=Sorangium sp. So ce260 TaxID=3133291 RepID=UPI003F641682